MLATAVALYSIKTVQFGLLIGTLIRKDLLPLVIPLNWCRNCFLWLQVHLGADYLYPVSDYKVPTLFIGNMNCMVRKSKPIGLLGPHSQRVKGQERGTRESKRREQTKQSTKQAGQLCRIALLWGTHQPQQQNQQQTKTAAQTNRHTHTWRQAYRSCCLTLKPAVSACLAEIERGRGERM